jgi:hypothetical protein
MSEEIASQSEESQEMSEESLAVLESFGLAAREPEEETEAEPPAIEEKPESKKRVVKFNKEDREIDETEVDGLLQKGLALDKERERKTEYEKALDRVAKQQGYKDHTELIANLDKMEQQAQQQKEDEYSSLESQLIQDFEDAGGDPDRLKSWLDNNPLLNKAKADMEQAKARESQETLTKKQVEYEQKWQSLYTSYPDLVESSQSFTKGEKPEWFNPQMQAMIERGYDPKDAYELANRDLLTAQTKKKAEQQAIKNQQLGRRSQVEGDTQGAPEGISLLPETINLANEFGVDLKNVQRQQKLIESRR